MKKLYDKIEFFIPQGLFILIFLLMSIEVFTRYVFNFAIFWNIELCRYSFVWLTFVGAGYVRKENAHIKIEMLFNYFYEKFPLRIQKVVWLSKELLSIIYLNIFAYKI